MVQEFHRVLWIKIQKRTGSFSKLCWTRLPFVSANTQTPNNFSKLKLPHNKNEKSFVQTTRNQSFIQSSLINEPQNPISTQFSKKNCPVTYNKEFFANHLISTYTRHNILLFAQTIFTIIHLITIFINNRITRINRIENFIQKKNRLRSSLNRN